MNSQNSTKGNKTQQIPQTELSRAEKPELARELMDVQPQIMPDSSQCQDNHSSTENPILDCVSKALRGENIKSAPDEEAVSTQIAAPFMGEASKLHQNYSESLACDNDYTLGVNTSELLAKFERYQEKILNDTKLEKELTLFMEPLTIYHNNTTREHQLLELSYEITRQFLTSQSSKDPSILLLAGKAGAGKTLFCQYLQRQILSNWNKNPEPEEDENWFPIYVELPSLKNLKSEDISEYLARELSLTEEEITLLKTIAQSILMLPRLLFIFDGYDEIEDIHTFHLRDSKEEFMKHNFFELNKIHEKSWKNAKFIITSREENLFGPLNGLPAELAIKPDSFLERTIEPFLDEQITSYLKKYSFFKQSSLVPALVNCLPSDLSQNSNSWEQVQLIEQLIDRYGFREIARVPSMLRIICQILPNITSEDFERRDTKDSTQTKKLSTRVLLDFFVSETIKTNLKRTFETMNSSKNQEESKDPLEAEKENQIVDPHIEAISRQVQNFALLSRGYSGNEIKIQGEVIDDSSLILKLLPLAKWDGNRSRIKFQYPWILEFYIAKSIEEEIREKVPSSALQDGKVELPRDLLINQRLLTYGASNSIVLFLLRDAVNDKRLTTEQLMKLIELSREKGVEQESNFAVAAANAITMLNAAGYDFSHQDLSSISIPGANLSYGMFEGTNFRNANLRGVDFTGAWLKDANLVEVQLANIDFGETLGLRLRNEQIFNIAYSYNGKYLAADVGDQTVIYENVSLQKIDFREIRRVPGSLLKESCSFSMDGQQILTAIKKGNPSSSLLSLCFWDVISGSCVEKLDVPIGYYRLIKFNPKRKEVMALDGKVVKKYSIERGSWAELSLTALDDARERWQLNAGDCDTLLVGSEEKRLTTLCSARTGKSLFKKERTYSSQFSTGGKQIVSTKGPNTIEVVDTVREHHMKTVALEQSHLGYSPLQLIGQRFLATRGYELLVLQDMSDAQTYLKIPLKSPDNLVYHISIDHSANQFAYKYKDVVHIEQLPTTTVLRAPTITIRGTNKKGLNLQGVIVNCCDKLSEKNIVILQKRGNYGAFPKTVLNQLFPSTSEELNAITEVTAISESLAPNHARIIGSNTYWSNLRKLDLSRNAIEEEGGEAIGDNNSWPNLEELTLSDTQIGNKTAIKIANNHIWKNMKKLELASNNIGEIGAMEIGKSQIWMNLEVLNLHQNEIEDEGARTIGENNSWDKLVTLDLSSNKINKKQTIISLCGNSSWKDLKYLILRDNPAVLEAADILEVIRGVASKSLEEISLSGAWFERALLQCLKYIESEIVIELPLSNKRYDELHAGIIGLNTTWTNLRTLDMRDNKINAAGATALSHNTTWTNLQTLNLIDNSIGAEGATTLSKNTTWTNLRTLEFGKNNIGDEGATALSKNTTWINLQTLSLNSNSISDEGATALSKNAAWAYLQTLDLEYNSIGYRGATALSKNTTWINLQTLNLRNNWIGDEGATALSKNTTWINLQTLNLAGTDDSRVIYNSRDNSIGDEGASALSKNTTWAYLHTLDLRHNKIRDRGATALSKNTTWAYLQTLDLGYNKIGDRGVTALSKNTTWAYLQTLDLGYNKIGAEGATALSKNTTWINLQTLNLRDNEIGDEGATALSQNITWTNLQTLDLGNNWISEEGAASLKTNQAWPKNVQIISSQY